MNHLCVPGSTLSVEGVRAGVSGTPAFYINGQQLVGAQIGRDDPGGTPVLRPRGADLPRQRLH